MDGRRRTQREPSVAGGSTRGEVASYVASLAADLSEMSRRQGLSTLAYLLDMARLEAEGAARAADALGDFGDLALRRHFMTAALRMAAWATRGRLTADDGSYVALAQALGAPLWTLDRRLARACPASVTVVTL